MSFLLYYETGIYYRTYSKYSKSTSLTNTAGSCSHVVNTFAIGSKSVECPQALYTLSSSPKYLAEDTPAT